MSVRADLEFWYNFGAGDVVYYSRSPPPYRNAVHRPPMLAVPTPDILLLYASVAVGSGRSLLHVLPYDTLAAWRSA
jgi:hypothetical protein